jgi:hypothetical protein
MAATEDRLQDGAINVRIGEGRTAEVLRNLCFQIYSLDDQTRWQALVAQIRELFGVNLNPLEFIKERGQITMSYHDGGIELDLVSSGGGLQQTLLLLAHTSTRTPKPSCYLTSTTLICRSCGSGRFIKS